jgi:hypothetical protein
MVGGISTTRMLFEKPTILTQVNDFIDSKRIFISIESFHLSLYQEKIYKKGRL